MVNLITALWNKSNDALGTYWSGWCRNKTVQLFGTSYFSKDEKIEEDFNNPLKNYRVTGRSLKNLSVERTLKNDPPQIINRSKVVYQ